MNEGITDINLLISKIQKLDNGLNTIIYTYVIFCVLHVSVYKFYIIGIKINDYCN